MPVARKGPGGKQSGPPTPVALSDGTKVAFADVVKGLKGKDKKGMFPGFDPDNATQSLNDVIEITPTDTCSSTVEVLYDTNFVIAASTESKRDELIKLASGAIQIVGDAPSANAIINGVNLVGKGIDAAIDTKGANGTYEFRFTPTVCSPPRYITVTFEVLASSLVLDADPDDKAEVAAYTMTLSTLGETKTDGRANDKKIDILVPLNGKLSIGPKCVSTYSVYSKLDISTKTDGRLFGRASVSFVKVDAIKITLDAATCPAEEHRLAPDGGGGTRTPAHGVDKAQEGRGHDPRVTGPGGKKAPAGPPADL